MTLGCSGGALVPAHRLKLALDFPIQVAASREKSFTGYSAAFLRSKRAARAEAGATVEVTVEATVAAAVVETARRKSTRKQVVCAMLRTANLEESDRRRAVRACAPLHENDSDTHSDVAHPWAHRPHAAAATLRGTLAPVCPARGRGGGPAIFVRSKFSGAVCVLAGVLGMIMNEQ